MGSQLHYKLNFFLLLYSVLKNTAVHRNNVFEGQLLVCSPFFLWTVTHVDSQVVLLTLTELNYVIS